MIKHSAVEKEAQPTGMHLGRRFGDVTPSREADEELAWFCNEAFSAIEPQCAHEGMLGGREPGNPQVVLARAEAIHAARKIWERLQRMGPRAANVVEALYTERVWPGALARRLGHLVGVVEGNPRVRAEWLIAREQGRTAATSTVAWLEELVAARSTEVGEWREQAVDACARALTEYEGVRGDEESVVPKEDF